MSLAENQSQPTHVQKEIRGHWWGKQDPSEVSGVKDKEEVYRSRKNSGFMWQPEMPVSKEKEGLESTCMCYLSSWVCMALEWGGTGKKGLSTWSKAGGQRALGPWNRTVGLRKEKGQCPSRGVPWESRRLDSLASAKIYWASTMYCTLCWHWGHITLSLSPCPQEAHCLRKREFPKLTEVWYKGSGAPETSPRPLPWVLPEYFSAWEVISTDLTNKMSTFIKFPQIKA